MLIPHEEKDDVITRINTCHNDESGRTLRLRTTCSNYIGDFSLSIYV